MTGTAAVEPRSFARTTFRSVGWHFLVEFVSGLIEGFYVTLASSRRILRQDSLWRFATSGVPLGTTAVAKRPTIDGATPSGGGPRGRSCAARPAPPA